MGARIVAACTLAIVLAAPALASESRLGRDARVLALHKARVLSSVVARVVRGIVDREDTRTESPRRDDGPKPATQVLVARGESSRPARRVPLALLNLPPPEC